MNEMSEITENCKEIEAEFYLSIPTEGTGINDHSQLENRDASDQHPIEAITGLSGNLVELDERLTNLEGNDHDLGDQVQHMQGDVNTLKTDVSSLIEDVASIKNSAPITGVYVDKYGIEADYAIHYGITDCPNGLIKYNVNNKEIEIQPGVVIQAAGSNTKTTLASATKYVIEETGKITLFFTKTESETGTTQIGFLEAGDVFYQEEEPTNGVMSFLAWWQPSRKLWQFKSNYTGNVWREAIATPIANINAGEIGITSINYIGYRIIDDDIFCTKTQLDDILSRLTALETK